MKFDKIEAKKFLSQFNLKENQEIWSILVGGATNEYKFEDNEIINLVENIIKKAKSKNIKILLTTSRRTSKKAEDLIEKLAQGYDNVLYSVLYNKNPQKVMSNFLQISNLIFVTEDSGSMITEAIYSKKPVITIKPNIVKQQNIFKLFIENCVKNRYIYSCNISTIESLNTELINFKKYDDEKNIENFIKIKELL
ncbi:MAG: mitochondrial fission ELM1 family protein [Campylobacteraceae bacterium]|nr:mitochondrial fission ELM1 family protein [Campylobacteraceae bacterium]